MPEYTSISLETDVKSALDTYRRQVEANRDQDLTHTDIVRELLDTAPEPDDL